MNRPKSKNWYRFSATTVLMYFLSGTTLALPAIEYITKGTIWSILIFGIIFSFTTWLAISDEKTVFEMETKKEGN